MALCKIACHLCPERAKCSPQTKAFVNYCGSNSEHFQHQIDKAIQECRARRGFLFKKDVLSARRLKRIIASLEPAIV
ncbi:MAG: hypothetical protein GF350_11460 [Chitinivibrionales bacterium]|nr:hypothetical protein [Chitinivibrionales bacterium]